MAITQTVMHKLQFARGIGQREMLRANTLPSITRAKVGCFARLRIYEENARFVLICIILIVYLAFGAALFHWLEWENEVDERKAIDTRMNEYRVDYCRGKPENECDFDEMVRFITDGATSGLLNSRSRFDMLGSLFFSATVISTIGFGTSTPRTQFGRFITIIYGVVGCTCCVLFFNLFLERLVTGMSYILRSLRERKIRYRLKESGNKPVTLLLNNEDFNESSSSCEGHMDNWRPSVYKVFFILFSMCLALITASAGVYSFIEDWVYVDSLYFCFISFATIGFGDYVSNQQDVTRMSPDLYRLVCVGVGCVVDEEIHYIEMNHCSRFVNFCLLTLGACFFYCLSNVSSIVVRQLLNWMIKKMDIKVDDRSFLCFKKKRRYMGLGLRPPKGYDMTSERSSVDYADGLLSLKEFLMNNQSSMIMLQKQLIKSAMKNVVENEEQKISATRVGPMGILDEAFGDEP
uniref:TWiK family of potassium channels protein 7 n=1 Tax=Caenorhabditis tropicalis TaxID=1561998 RepID=A0A1I7TBX0_9PELO